MPFSPSAPGGLYRRLRLLLLRVASRAVPPPAFEADQRDLPGSSPRDILRVLLTAGLDPAIAIALPATSVSPVLRTNMPLFGTYWRYPACFGLRSFVVPSHSAQIAPVRITVIDSAVVAARVSGVSFQSRPPPNPHYSKSFTGETRMLPHVLSQADAEPAISCGFRTMPISIPKRCRSGLRADADHDSDAKPITNRVGIGTVIGTS